MSPRDEYYASIEHNGDASSHSMYHTAGIQMYNAGIWVMNASVYMMHMLSTRVNDRIASRGEMKSHQLQRKIVEDALVSETREIFEPLPKIHAYLLSPRYFRHIQVELNQWLEELAPVLSDWLNAMTIAVLNAKHTPTGEERDKPSREAADAGTAPNNP